MAKRKRKSQAQEKADAAPGSVHMPRLADLATDCFLSGREYAARLDALHGRLKALQQAYLATGDRGIVVFEGWDASGKGGVIRRLTAAMDPRSCHVWPIGSPTDKEQGKHYLFRFWQRLPDPRTIAVFDRSWYGRVLVERVEGLASEAEWRRAYHEIKGFERVLAADGVRIVKIFLHVTPEEQLKRFRARLDDPLKRWKLSEEDFRNRRRWRDYELAVEEMIAKTSTDRAPWVLVPANDKKYGRIKAIEAVAEALSSGVDLSPRPLPPAVLREARALFGSKVPDDAFG
ncbi:MAG TPA: polyphosphate kinase [Alphaproteobacteria bacterium]|nr:polyphosphate kinase [Alphaproteobacteria bacterium]